MRAFRRLHPATPLLRGWKWLAGIVAVVGQSAIREGDPTQLALIALVVLVVGLIVGTVSWWFTRYGIDGGDLRVDSGIVFRRSRRVRLDRLQAVDVVRPLVGRALGVSELRLEVAGGGPTEAPLAYLAESDAIALRAELIARAAGLDADTPEAPERPFVEVPFSALALSTVLSPAFIIGALLTIAIAAGAGFARDFVIVTSMLPLLLGAGTAVYQQLVRNYGFTLSESPDGLRIRKGLLDIRSQTVPPGRVQGAAIHHPLLWRRQDWAKVQVNVAGYGGDLDGATHESTLLPVAPVPLARQVLGRVLRGVDVEAVPLGGVPRRVRWLRPLTWRSLGCGADDEVFVAQEGRFHRVLSVVPHAKTQSVRIRQGPIQRWLGLASVFVDIPPGPVSVVARHRDISEVRRIVDQQAERARKARRTAGPERWMSSSFQPSSQPPPQSPAPQQIGDGDALGLSQPGKVAEPTRSDQFGRQAGRPDGG